MTKTLRQAREEAGLTQAQVGEAVGRDQSTVSKWEKGDYVPEREIAPRLAELLGMNVVDVLYPAKPAQTDRAA